MDYKDYLKTEHWLNLRKEILIRDNYQCTSCGSEIESCVHHLTYKNIGNEPLEDLITLCKKCHYKIHKYNPDYSFTKYESDKRFEEECEKRYKEEMYYFNFIKENEELIQIINDYFKNNPYINQKDFIKLIKPFNKLKCTDSQFAWNCMTYFDLVFICGTMKPLEWLPKGFKFSIKLLIIPFELYKKHNDVLHIVKRFYSASFINPLTAFNKDITYY